jgi:hypothetical protein
VLLQVAELLQHTQSVYSIEYMTLLDADHHILASLGMKSRVGEVFNPENILTAAANVTIDDDSVWLSGLLTYDDLMKEEPPLYFDRESQKDMAMKVYNVIQPTCLHFLYLSKQPIFNAAECPTKL